LEYERVKISGSSDRKLFTEALNHCRSHFGAAARRTYAPFVFLDRNPLVKCLEFVAGNAKTAPPALPGGFSEDSV
jgi:hypothetical protein